MRLFDSHCHLDDPLFEADLPAVCDRMARNAVRGVMIVGIDAGRSRRAVALAHRLAGAWASVGVHPHDAAGCSEAVLEALRGLAHDPRVKAWGETGLDFNRMYAPRADQERWFARQLEVARDLDLPLILHERDSGGRLIEMLRASDWPGRQGVVHCFSGTARELDRYLEMGFCIGITGIVTHTQRGRDLRLLVPRIPVERLLVETDAPYLTPSPERNRQRRNEPAFVRTVMLKAAEVRGEDPEILAAAVWDNTCRLFRVPVQAPV
jgi:TatD DNase family protein